MERIALATLLLAACHGAKDDTAADTAGQDTAADAFPLEGTWDDDWGGVHVITTTTWTMTYPKDSSVFHVEEIALEEQYLVALNDTANAWYPDLYSRFDWVLVDAAPWYCQVAFDAADAAAAAGAGGADRTDPAAGGCGGYAWTRLVPHGR